MNSILFHEFLIVTLIVISIEWKVTYFTTEIQWNCNYYSFKIQFWTSIGRNETKIDLKDENEIKKNIRKSAVYIVQLDIFI